MPLELQQKLKHTAYASQCMFSRLERDVEGKVFGLPSPIWDRGTFVPQLDVPIERKGCRIGNSCDYQHTWRHRGCAGSDGLRGDSIEISSFLSENTPEIDKEFPQCQRVSFLTWIFQ